MNLATAAAVAAASLLRFEQVDLRLCAKVAGPLALQHLVAHEAAHAVAFSLAGVPFEVRGPGLPEGKIFQLASVTGVGSCSTATAAWLAAAPMILDGAVALVATLALALGPPTWLRSVLVTLRTIVLVDLTFNCATAFWSTRGDMAQALTWAGLSPTQSKLASLAVASAAVTLAVW